MHISFTADPTIVSDAAINAQIQIFVRRNHARGGIVFQATIAGVVQRRRINVEITGAVRGGIVVVERPCRTDDGISPTAEERAGIIQRSFGQQIKRTIFSDDAAVIVVDVLSRKRDTFFTYDAANVVGKSKQRAVITQEVIPVAVFEVAASVNNQLFIRRDQRSVVVNRRFSIDRNILTGNQTIGVVYDVRRQSHVARFRGQRTLIAVVVARQCQRDIAITTNFTVIVVQIAAFYRQHAVQRMQLTVVIAHVALRIDNQIACRFDGRIIVRHAICR